MKPIAWGWLALGGGIIAYLIVTSSKTAAAAGLSSTSSPSPSYAKSTATPPLTTLTSPIQRANNQAILDQANQVAAEQTFLQGLSGNDAPFPTGG